MDTFLRLILNPSQVSGLTNTQRKNVLSVYNNYTLT